MYLVWGKKVTEVFISKAPSWNYSKSRTLSLLCTQLKHTGFQSIRSRYANFRQLAKVILQTERDFQLQGRRAGAPAPHLQPVSVGISFASTRLAGTVWHYWGWPVPTNTPHISAPTSTEGCSLPRDSNPARLPSSQSLGLLPQFPSCAGSRRRMGGFHIGLIQALEEGAEDWRCPLS